MKQVIRITEVEEPKKELKPIDFTHYQHGSKGWIDAEEEPNEFEQVLYIGRCDTDGDMFAAYSSKGSISIYKGHLNDGVY